jgi:hypothetical protein
MSQNDNTANTLATVPANNIPPIKKYANSWIITGLGFYFALLGILLAQNIFSFWMSSADPNSKEVSKIFTEYEYKLETAKASWNAALNQNTPQGAQTPPKPAIDSLRKQVDQLSKITENLKAFRENNNPVTEKKVVIITWTIAKVSTDRDQALLILVFLLGALGSWLHAISSYMDFVGNRNFILSWIPWYILRPIVGGVLAVIFYVAFRAGFFPNSTAGIDAINPFGMAAVASLVGLFTQRATKKLADVFDAIFPTAQQNKDPLVSKTSKATIDTFTPGQVTLNTPDLKIAVKGANFTDKSKAIINRVPRETKVIDNANLSFTLLPADVQAVGTLNVSVYDPETEDQGANASALKVVALSS